VKVLKAGIAAPAALYAGTLTGPVSDLVGVTGQSGCASGSFTVYVCVQWLDSGGLVKGYAKGTAKVELDRPAAPEIDAVGAGDTRLTVTIKPTSGTPAAATFSASAAADPAVDPVVHGSSRVATDGTARLDGLKNGVEYMVTAYTYSAVGNRSPASIAKGPYVPQPAADAWDVYKKSGGRDSGGCQSGGAGLAALLGAASLLTLRRRS
jgi:hypothetical protein